MSLLDCFLFSTLSIANPFHYLIGFRKMNYHVWKVNCLPLRNSLKQKLKTRYFFFFLSFNIALWVTCLARSHVLQQWQLWNEFLILGLAVLKSELNAPWSHHAFWWWTLFMTPEYVWGEHREIKNLKKNCPLEKGKVM